MHPKTPLALAILALTMSNALIHTPARAQTPPPDDTDQRATRLREITVTSTRTERPVDAVPNTVTVKSAAEIEASGARDLKDLLRNELDVTVPMGPARFTAAGSSTGRPGNEGINIRGLEGNQVLMLIDGVRVPGSFSFGAFTTGRGDFLDVDTLSSVEVLRGPASTQFGSDGLAGAISLVTLSPDDVLKGRRFGGFGRVGYASVDRSWNTTGAVAGTTGDWKGLLLLTHRAGHETDNRGDNASLDSSRTTPNPVDARSDHLLGKLSYKLNASNEFGFTADVRQRRQTTEIYSGRAPVASAATSVIDLDAKDDIERQRFAVEHRFDDLNGRWLQKARTIVYAQSAEVRQQSFEDRLSAADRTRDNRYRDRIAGLSTQAETNLTGTVQQRISYGVDASISRISALRDGTVAPFGETFPTRPFPDTRFTLAGAFAQSEIEAGRFTVIPGLRFDGYKLSPDAAGYTGGAVKSLSDHALTPRLGVIWKVQDNLAPYVQWSRGFRAPTPDQVNNGFTNVASGYTSVGNPNLKAERASSLELGLRLRFGPLRWQVSAYDNRYRDFISQQVVGGAGTPADPTVFQYINLANARIRGGEVRALWEPFDGLSLNGGFGTLRAHTTINGVKTPLDTEQPGRVSAGVNWRVGAWRLQAQWLHAEAKDASRLSTATLYAPPSYDVIDIGATWQINPTWRLIANVNNLTDAKYWRWSDVRGQTANSTTLDAYTAPGRNAQIAVRADF